VVHAPSLSERGEVHVSVHGSPVDWQGNVAYAVLPHVAVRGQVDAHPGVLMTGDVGVGVFGALGAPGVDGAPKKEGLRWGLAADVGAGDNSTWTASNTAILGQAGEWQKSEFHTNFTRVSVQGELALVREKFQFIGVLRHTQVRGKLTEKAMRRQTGGALETERRTVDVEWYALEPAVVFRPQMAGEVYWEMQFGTSQLQGRYTEDFANRDLLWPLIIVLGLGGNF
jgi:hypothetical protein